MDRSEDPAALHAEILAGLRRWSASQDWVEDGGRFIKMPLVWLNQKNWKDSPAPYSPRETGCRHCAGKGCSRGIVLPPDHRLNARPHRPEECPGFFAKEGGAA